MSITFLAISILAGALTLLAPCILPLIPVVIGTGINARSKWTPYIVVGSLGFSILIFTYLLKVSTYFIAIPNFVWSYISGGILALFGLILLFPVLWNHIPFVNKLSRSSNQLVGTGHQKKSIWGDVLVGAALGPVFSSCSPTYFVILATVLPESFLVGTIYLLGYIAGLIFVLLIIALLGQQALAKLTNISAESGLLKRMLGILFVLLGVAIIFGYDKVFEAWLLDNNYLGNIINFETELIESNLN
tara:strand:- start:1915 stop:2652 length:738 start_codon:yes stop_codon:yes gene_type:complete